MFSSDKWFGSTPSFYNDVVRQSLRFNDNDSASLSWTPSSAGNRKKWTFSTWVKRSTITNASSGDVYIFSQATGSNNNDSFMALLFRGDDLDVTCHSIELLRSNAKFRDVGAWYHILWVLDTENSTASHRMRLYVNGDEITSFSSDQISNSQLDGTDMPILNNATHYIGRYGGDTSRNFDGYLAYTELVEGEALTPSSFTEEKNGALIPKEYTGDHGTYGFRLEYKQTGDGSSSPSSSTIGADTKSNATKQHWNDNNLDAYDSNMPDSPENNFCTLNPIGRRYGQSYVGTFTEGALKFTSGGNATNVFGTMAINQIVSQGGVYFELRFDSIDSVRTYFGVIGDSGVNNKNITTNSGGYTFPIKGMLSSVPRGYFTTDTDASNSVDLTANTAFSNGDVAGIAILSDGKFFVHRNGTYLNDASGNTGNPSTGANPIATIDLTEGDWLPYLGYSSSYSANFGQDGTFAGQETSGGNQDGNGIGDFMFAVPTNCLALCTSNMAEPTIGPNSTTQADDHFNTVLYTGSGSTQSITGVGFQSDWSWFKRRDATVNHALYDSIRGGTNALRSNTNGAPAQFGDAVITFQSDGFQIAGTNVSGINGSSDSMVAWNWKASGSSVTNNDGSIASTVSANTTAGFSIVKATSPSSGTWTVGHGLGATPDFVIQKYLASSSRWTVWQNSFTSGQYLGLNESNAIASSGTPFNFTFNSTVIGGNANYDGTSTDVIYYVFKEIDGYSKFANFTGNGNADGPFVFTGFRPAWVLIKNTARGADWRLHDIARQPTNDDGGHILLPNSSSSEVTSEYDIDFLSNGFKLRSSDVYENGNGESLIFAAFAETPFKYALAK